MTVIKVKPSSYTEFAVRRGFFYGNPSWEESRLKDHGRMMVRKFLAGEITEGWTEKGPPLIVKMKIVHEAENETSLRRLWRPNKDSEFTLSSRDPRVTSHPGMDIYMVYAPMFITHKPLVVEIDDEIIKETINEKGSWLDGWEL